MISDLEDCFQMMKSMCDTITKTPAMCHSLMIHKGKAFDYLDGIKYCAEEIKRLIVINQK